MKKFKFRLQKVLEHKLKLFDIAKEEFFLEQKKLIEQEKKLEEFVAEYRTTVHNVVQETKNSFRIRDLGVYYKYLFHLKREMKVQADVVSQHNAIVAEKRERLIEISKEKEVLIKLKEKRRKQYLYTLDFEEQKTIDDLTSAKYSRQYVS